MAKVIKPDQYLIIIGSAKCGTTSLFDYLSQHPAICPSDPKEPEFFTEHRERRRPVSRYEDVWPAFDPAVHRYALEGSTGYTMWPQENDVAKRMLAYGIRPRIVYLVRDPIKRIESHVNFRRINSRQRASFDDSFFVDVSRYAAQLDPYVEAFGAESIRVVDFAHLCADLNKVCADLYDWLDLEPHTVVDSGISNETATLRKSQLERSDTLKRIVRKLPPGLQHAGRNLALKVVPYRHERVGLSPERNHEIRQLLREDVERISKEWGVDVSSWGFDDISTDDDLSRPNQR
ncbi:hypothetical protein B1R94_04920 [Mycolicibacterium litorale]|nr:hypothetical protein B1R94_04920 [Mycolicibacterium litorale]